MDKQPEKLTEQQKEQIRRKKLKMRKIQEIREKQNRSKTEQAHVDKALETAMGLIVDLRDLSDDSSKNSG